MVRREEKGGFAKYFRFLYAEIGNRNNVVLVSCLVVWSHTHSHLGNLVSKCWPGNGVSQLVKQVGWKEIELTPKEAWP